MKHTCIIVDDEPLAQDVLESYVKKLSSLQLVGKCNNAFEAMELLRASKAEIVFLDIQMPGITGLEFLRSLQVKPVVIFTTAHASHALEGFDLDVMDYLLKPISFDRFTRAVNKAIHYITLEKQEGQQANADEDNHIFVKADKKIVKINLNDILYIEGLKDYVMIFIPGQRIITLQTMKNLEERLPSNKFIRVHRSFIIAIDKLKSISSHSVEIGAKQIPIGKNYKDEFMKVVDKQNIIK
ncbi:LytTR family DNA-binding domain-containing protein [soil metagenome]